MTLCERTHAEYCDHRVNMQAGPRLDNLKHDHGYCAPVPTRLPHAQYESLHAPARIRSIQTMRRAAEGKPVPGRAAPRTPHALHQRRPIRQRHTNASRGSTSRVLPSLRGASPLHISRGRQPSAPPCVSPTLQFSSVEISKYFVCLCADERMRMRPGGGAGAVEVAVLIPGTLRGRQGRHTGVKAMLKRQEKNRGGGKRVRK
ncbi:unnamed protein product [Pleuronectes platessa]|uniref:Uncharacterized protein n=1 Tax=Pleuronectes platessa TaxID=8262 RepID=A0A9N7Y6E3_PLEPL|nr:unnamed protein product [Pleuronectes platessa]